MGCAKPLFEKRVSKMMQENGVTLVELLVAMTIGLAVMAAIYSTYNSQQQQYLVQEQVSGMQQNLRASVYFIARETRMAGYDPTESGNFALEVTPYWWFPHEELTFDEYKKRSGFGKSMLETLSFSMGKLTIPWICKKGVRDWIGLSVDPHIIPPLFTIDLNGF